MLKSSATAIMSASFAASAHAQFAIEVESIEVTGGGSGFFEADDFDNVGFFNDQLTVTANGDNFDDFIMTSGTRSITRVSASGGTSGGVLDGFGSGGGEGLATLTTDNASDFAELMIEASASAQIGVSGGSTVTSGGSSGFVRVDALFILGEDLFVLPSEGFSIFSSGAGQTLDLDGPTLLAAGVYIVTYNFAVGVSLNEDQLLNGGSRTVDGSDTATLEFSRVPAPASATTLLAAALLGRRRRAPLTHRRTSPPTES